MKKNILIPTDFSDNAENAIRYAVNFFGVDNQFFLLNTWQSPYTSSEVLISVEDIIMKGSKEGLKKEANWMKTFDENISCETLSEFGNLVDIINSVVREKSIDYVVMGTQGATGLKETLLGSNTASAAKSLNCPLLTVPTEASFNGIKNVVFAADYKEIENTDVLKPLVAIGKSYDAEITILNVLDKGKVTDIQQGYEGIKIDHFLAGVKHKYDFVEEDDKANGIDNYVRSTKPDMLVMLERKTGFFKSIFHKSITKQMAFHSHLPILVLHN